MIVKMPILTVTANCKDANPVTGSPGIPAWPTPVNPNRVRAIFPALKTSLIALRRNDPKPVMPREMDTNTDLVHFKAVKWVFTLKAMLA